MRIDRNTRQADLEKLYAAIVRQEFLRGTPLNIKPFLRYTLLFLLFPGMIFGFWAGLASTGVFCAILLALLLAEHAAWGAAAVCCWLALGLIPAVFITWDTLKRARSVRSRRLQMRDPMPHPSPKACSSPQHQPLSWRAKRSKRGQSLQASLIVSVPDDGVYAYLLTIGDYTGERLVMDSPQGVCVAESSGKRGETLHALLLYRLRKGQHELAWSLASSAKPTASISQLNS